MLSIDSLLKGSFNPDIVTQCSTAVANKVSYEFFYFMLLLLHNSPKGNIVLFSPHHSSNSWSQIKISLSFSLGVTAASNPVLRILTSARFGRPLYVHGFHGYEVNTKLQATTVCHQKTGEV